MKNLKQKLFNIVSPAGTGKLSKLFDVIIIFLIITNIILVVAETFSVPAEIKALMSGFEVFSVTVFSIEYILRLWTSDLLRPDIPAWRARLRYAFSFMAVIDLIAILPFYLPLLLPIDLRVLRALRVIRLLRVFKINRYTNALSTIGQVFKNKASQLISSMLVVALLIIIASVLMYNIENAAQPETFSNAIDTMWWAIATLTTVGYGDIYPVTAAGKIFATIIAFLGIGLVAVPTGIISAGFTEIISKEKESSREEPNFCPRCGYEFEVNKTKKAPGAADAEGDYTRG